MPIDVVPTGVDLAAFSQGDGSGFRSILGIPHDAFVVGHLGRLAPEKNLSYLCNGVVKFMQKEPRAHFILVGKGSIENTLMDVFYKNGLRERVHKVGFLQQPFLASAFKAMNVFVFSSLSETQGMVLTESMAAGVPVIALDAPGVRDVVADEQNGRLLSAQTSYQNFAKALHWFIKLPETKKAELSQYALATAELYSLDKCAQKAIKKYLQLLGTEYNHRHHEHQLWTDAINTIRAEFDIVKGYAKAAARAMKFDDRA